MKAVLRPEGMRKGVRGRADSEGAGGRRDGGQGGGSRAPPLHLKTQGRWDPREGVRLLQVVGTNGSGWKP